LNLNGIMSIIANVPAAIASTIVACRAVRRLTNYTCQGPEVFATTTQGSTLVFRSQGSNPPISTPNKKAIGGVHVQMETFASPSDRSFVQYDAAGKVIVKADSEDKCGGADEGYDVESQVIRDDFKRPPY